MQERPGLLARLNSYARWLLLSVMVCVAGGVVCRQILINRLDDEIRVRLRSMLAAHYPDMEVHIRNARRVEGQGIEIRGLSISSPREETAHRDLLFIDEMFLECGTDLSELLRRGPRGRRLIVRGMRLHATCHEEGRWNISSLLPLPDFGGSVPSIVVEDATLELQDLCRPSGGIWSFRNIALKAQSGLDAQRGKQWRLSGSLLGDHFKRVHVEGLIDADRGSWSARGTIDGLEMSQRLLDALPNEIAQYASVLATLRARARFQFRLDHQPDNAEPVRVTASGHLSEGRVDDPRLPLPLTDLEADVYISNDQIRIENLLARSGSTDLKMACQCERFLSDSPRLQLTASIRRLPLDERLYAVLPERLRDHWDKFSPSGLVDAEIAVELQDNQFIPDITVTCRDVSFSYYKFAFRMRQGRGDVQWVGNTVYIRDFTALAGDQVVHMAGQFQNPGHRFTGWFDLSSEGPIPINHELISAMNETGQQITRSLNPTGGLTVTRGRIEKREPDGEPHSRWELTLDDCSIQYDRFPYAIHGISGRLVLEDRRWTFDGLRGRHGSSYITCRGHWEPTATAAGGGMLQLDFKCWDVPLNDSLRNAVGKYRVGAQQFWDDIRPRGTIDYARISLQLNTSTKQTSLELFLEKWPPDQNIEGRSITIHPRWLSLKLEDCTGRFHFSNGQFQLEKFAAKRGSSRVELAGHGKFLPERQWEITFSRLIADSLQVDHELTSALPSSLRSGIRQLNYQGTLSLNGHSRLQGGVDRPLLGDWDVLLDIDDGAIANQLQLEHIYGGIRLQGRKNAQGFQCRGTLDIDSLMTHGIQVTQIQGPFRIDSKQLTLGSQASVVKQGNPPRQITAKAMKGDVAVDAVVILDDPLRFAVDLSLSNASIAELAHTVLARQHHVSGKGFAAIHLNGTEAGLHTLQGTGQLRLREADIYELPLMARLLNLLSLRPPDDTAFTSSDVDFRLQGEQIYFDRVDFSGDAISLKGHGWMDLNRHVNLNFYALVGRQDLQFRLIRMLLAEASKNILGIQVVGDIDNPQIIKKPLPELDDTLQRLFPEAVPRTAER